MHVGGGMRGGGPSGGKRGGGFRGGFRTGFKFGNNFRFRNRFGIPVFYGGLGFYDPFFFDSFPYSYPDAYPFSYPYSDYGSSGPSVMIISNPPYPYPPPPPEAAPPPPSVREYPPPQAQEYETPLFLLAFKDGTIRAVLAYWVDGPTLRYVSMDHEQKQTPLTSIDRDLSERLNRERNVIFSLPR
jgi:hypothetical protein